MPGRNRGRECSNLRRQRRGADERGRLAGQNQRLQGGMRIGLCERRGAVDEKSVRLVRHAAPQFEEPAELHDPRSLRRVLDQLLRRGEQGGGAVPLAGEPGVLRCGGEPPAPLTSI